VTRGRLPQRAGSLGLNGGGAAATVPQTTASITPLKQPYCISMITSSMRSDLRSCHASSLICLLLSISLTITSWSPAFHIGLELTAPVLNWF